MTDHDYAALFASTDRKTKIARAGLSRALLEAEESDRGLLSSGGLVERVSGGGAASSVVEAAALGRVSNRDRLRLWRAAQKVESAAMEFASLVAATTSPAVRNDPKTGKVVVKCGNKAGCPSGSDAKREGLCESCWWHFQQGGWRTADDVEAQKLERLRKDRERKR